MKRQLPLFILMLALGALAFFSLKRVQFSASIFELLPDDLVEVRGMDWLNRYFSRNGQLVVTIESTEVITTEQVTRDLAAHFRGQNDRVSAVFEEMPLDRLALEGGSLLAWMWLNADPEELGQLTGRLQAPASQYVIAQTMEALQEGLIDQSTLIRSYDPLGISQLPNFINSGNASESDAMSSKDKLFRLFYVEGSGVDFSDYRSSAKWLDEMKSDLATWRADNNIDSSVKIGLTGTPAFMAEGGKEMEKDMTVSVMATLALISILFWIMHRQTQPLGWLIAALCLVLIVTLNIGGYLFGNLSVMSAGFAAILLGLAVDYAIVLYREALNDGISSPKLLRAKVGSAIAWAAVTTAAVFLSLNFSSLPGIAEMGNLVAIGIALGAIMMLFGYAWVAAKFAGNSEAPRKQAPASERGAMSLAILALLFAIAIPIATGYSIYEKTFPKLEAEFHPFRIRSSPSMESWKSMQSHLRGEDTATPMVIKGSSMNELLERLAESQSRLDQATTDGLLKQVMLPLAFVPRPANQQANAAMLKSIVAQKGRLISEIEAAGFSEDGTTLTKEVLDIWQASLDDLDAGKEFAMPHGEFAEWTVGRLFKVNEDQSLAALGSVLPTEAAEGDWIDTICDEHSAVASMKSLGKSLNKRINSDLKKVFLPMIGILIVMLAIVFRSWKDWLLALFSLVFAACVMVILTLWTPLSWNSFNICGLPLLFGTGLDFGIHMIFALRRSEGRLFPVRQGISKALLFCGMSSAIGFGSMAFASAHGLASLGQICAVGILVNMIIAVWLLPFWYRLLHGIR